MKVCAVIPIKTNNQRVPGKNTRFLGGKPLLLHSFEAVKNSSLIDDIFINTSDIEIQRLALDWGFEIIDRPLYLNEPEAQGNHLITQSLENIGEYDIYVEHHATNPFMTSGTLDRCVSMIDPPDVTSVFPVVEIFNRLWYRDKEVNHSYSKLIGTQFMDPVLEEAGLYVFHIPSFIKERSRVTANRKTLIISKEEAFDIDTELDFKMAEALYNELSGL